MTITRIHTEDVNRGMIESILTTHFSEWTMLRSTGSWHGQTERSLVIEVWDANPQQVNQAAAEIKAVNHQQAVAITKYESEITLI